MDICKELHILVGLPGAGKSYWASEFKKNKIGICVIDFDKIEKEAKGDYSKAVGILSQYYPSYITVIDGLFLTEKVVIQIIIDYMELFPKYKFQNIIIDYWEPNIEACLINDLDRRAFSSSNTIKHFKLEKPSLLNIKEECCPGSSIHTQLVSHKTVSRSLGQIWAECSGVHPEADGELHSSTWTLWCTHRSYNGHSYPGDAEEPKNFDELDNLLEEVCPNITFLQYKRIVTPLVEQRKREIYDYYTSGEEGYWSINCDKLYKALLENGIIKEFNLA